MTTCASSGLPASACSNCAARLNDCEQRLSALESSLASLLNLSRELAGSLANAERSLSEVDRTIRLESDRQQKEGAAMRQVYSQIAQYLSAKSKEERRT